MALRALNGPLSPYYDGNAQVVGFSGTPGDVMTAGSGITGSQTGIPYSAYVQADGPYLKTTILIDLQGLNSSAAGDIIGGNGLANCHFGQITTARNGKIFRGQISCLEAPTGGENDVDVHSATAATGTEDAAVSGLSQRDLQLAAADYTVVGVTKAFTAVPAADEYLYLSGSGGGTDATYTAGQFVIEMWGVKV